MRFGAEGNEAVARLFRGNMRTAVAYSLALVYLGCQADKAVQPSEEAKKILKEASSLLHSRKPERARALYEKALSHDPRNVDAYQGLARSLQSAGRIKDVLRAANKAIRYSESPRQRAESWIIKALVLFNSDRPRKAIKCLDRAQEARPRWDAVYYNRGLVYRRLGETEKAEADFRTAISLSSSPAARDYSALGSCLRSLGRHSEAAEEFRRAIAADENGYAKGAWHGLMVLPGELDTDEQAREKVRGALEAYRKLEGSSRGRRAKENWAPAYFRTTEPKTLGETWARAALLTLKAADSSLPLRCARRAVELSPDDAFARSTLSWCLLNAGDIRGAVRGMEHVVVSGTEEPFAHLALGRLLLCLGRSEMAREVLQRVLETDEGKGCWLAWMYLLMATEDLLDYKAASETCSAFRKSGKWTACAAREFKLAPLYRAFAALQKDGFMKVQMRSERIEVPMRNRILPTVVVKLNGQPVRVAVDTGLGAGTLLMVSERAAKKAGLTVKPTEASFHWPYPRDTALKAGAALADKVELGGATISNVPVVVLDTESGRLPVLPWWFGTEGILGLQFVKKFHVTLDYVGRNLILRPESRKRAWSVADALDGLCDANVVFTRPGLLSWATLDGGALEGPFVVDTGASHNVVFRGPLSSVAEATGRTYKGEGERGPVFEFRLAGKDAGRFRIRVLRKKIRSEPGGIRPCGLIGHPLLRRFVVQFDFDSMRVALNEPGERP